MDAAAVAAVSSIVGAVDVTDVGADVVEAATTGAAAAAVVTPGADAAAEDTGPGAMVTLGMDILNPTIETAIHASESVLHALAKIGMMEITRLAKNRVIDLPMKKAATVLRPQSS
jgi:hypothetical protein